MRESRSKKAQAIHTLLFDVFKDKKNINPFKNALTEATDEVLKETSVNGFTLLHDIIHLTDDEVK